MPTPMMLPTISAIAVVRPNRAGGLAAVPTGAVGFWVVVDIVHLMSDSCSGFRRFEFISGAAVRGLRSVPISASRRAARTHCAREVSACASRLVGDKAVTSAVSLLGRAE